MSNLTVRFLNSMYISLIILVMMPSKKEENRGFGRHID